MEALVGNVTNWRAYVLSKDGGSYSVPSYCCWKSPHCQIFRFFKRRQIFYYCLSVKPPTVNVRQLIFKMCWPNNTHTGNGLWAARFQPLDWWTIEGGKRNLLWTLMAFHIQTCSLYTHPPYCYWLLFSNSNLVIQKTIIERSSHAEALVEFLGRRHRMLWQVVRQKDEQNKG